MTTQDLKNKWDNTKHYCMSEDSFSRRIVNYVVGQFNYNMFESFVFEYPGMNDDYYLKNGEMEVIIARYESETVFDKTSKDEIFPTFHVKMVGYKFIYMRLKFDAYAWGTQRRYDVRVLDELEIGSEKID